MPTEAGTTLIPSHLQVALRRRLRLPLPMIARRCNGRSCRRRLDDLGDHRASCPVSGRLRRRAGPLEKAWARVLREAGVRIQENVLLRDTNLPGIAANDQRAIEIIAHGVPWYHGVPLACDASMVSPLHADGSVWEAADEEDGVALARAEQHKRTTYHELVHSDRCRLVVLACETGGRWSKQSLALVRDLAWAKAQQAPPMIRANLRQAYFARWTGLLAVCMQDTLASSLLDDNCMLGQGQTGQEPSWSDLLLDEGMRT